MGKTRVIIMGAAGRDFHNFNVFFRDNPDYEVVAFTATQIPNIAGRVYPPELAGSLYPSGIWIFSEEKLLFLIREYDADEVIFAYSDVSHQYLMDRASLVLSYGADFRLMGPKTTMLKSKKPVISVCAVRTGSGKSQTTRKVCQILKEKGYDVAIVRHPMAYGKLEKHICQRFGTYEDLKSCSSIEEQEEYERHVRKGVPVYSGIDCQKVLEGAEQEAGILVWDGGNNDFPFIKPDFHIVVADPLRPGDELNYYPGQVNLEMADVVIINKQESARPEDIALVRRNIMRIVPLATIIDAASPISVERPELIRGKRVVVIEDGPSLTHGERRFGAGMIAARKFGASEIIDPRPYARGSIKKIFEDYPHIGPLLPATGYGERQIKDLEETINAIDCDAVVIATPVDLARVVRFTRPTVRVSYELQEIGRPNLEDVLEGFLERK